MVAHLEVAERIEADDSAASSDAAGQEKTRSFLHLLTPARLTSRIVLLNIAGLIVLVSGILYFNQFRQGLIDAQVQSLLTQGHIIAAALASTASVDTDSIVIDPDRLIEARPDSGPCPTATISATSTFPSTPSARDERSEACCRPPTIRGRIFDRDGMLVVDSTPFSSAATIIPGPSCRRSTKRKDKVLKSLWRRFNGWVFSNDYPLQKEYGLDNGKDFPEVAAALAGASVSSCASTTRTRSSFRSPCRSSASARCSARSCCRPPAARSTMSSRPSARSCSSPSFVAPGHHPAVGAPCRHHRRADPPAFGGRRACPARHQQARRDP